MPELPAVTLYVERLAAFTVGRSLEKVRFASPFLLRSVTPPISSVEGKRVVSTGRIGKRIVISLEGDLHLVIHLMIAGRLRWKARGFAIPKKRGLAAFDFEHGTLSFTEASPKKRASLHVVEGRLGLEAFDRGGIDLLARTTADVAAALRSEVHTLKRALTDPTIVDGVGNAYSDEILHRAKMSPFIRTTQMTDDEIERLHHAANDVLHEWIERGRAEIGDGFPDEVTAFHERMAVHGKFGKPCPACGTPVQRIRYAENEANYCPTCQTGGKLLADRSLSRLMHDDWPKTLEELEDRKRKSAAEGEVKPSKKIARRKK
jgi:formamidopyrimidine-DNA glycosylase